MIKIALGYKEVNGPWGGGNRFIRSLKDTLTENNFVCRSNLKDKDIAIILLTDPRFRSPLVNFSIAEIIFYKVFINPKVIIVHRVNECDERKNTNFMNYLLINANWCADFTVFVGSWLIDLNCWKKNIRTPYKTILNGADKNVFNSIGYKKWNDAKPLKLVTHHWGGNWMKGFDVYKKIDEMLNDKYWRSRISFTYIGNLPKGFLFKNVKYRKPLNDLKLAAELKKHHVYLTASINEPGGNHQNEGAMCGLPLLYRDSGCLPEYCNGYGIMFNSENFISSLNQMRKDYKLYIDKMKKYPNNFHFTSLQYIDLFNNLVNNNIILHNNRRFFIHPLKTIKSIFVM
jgi:hypothetical protein